MDLTALFGPKSIAVVGVSRNPQKIGAVVLKNILDSGYKGTVYPVNPNGGDGGGLKYFLDIDSLPEIPDLAIVALPAEKIGETLEALGAKGIKNAVILAAGFREIGAKGEALEKELVAQAEKFQINILGPNCLGFVNNFISLNATFAKSLGLPGNLRLISQSGALAAGIFGWCQTTGLNFSHFITIGNKAVINENHCLKYFLETSGNYDPKNLSKVRPVGLYLESITNGQEFIKIVSEISRTDPVFVLKPGKSEAAAKAMQSHTGAIAGEDAVLEAALGQCGAVRCQETEDFFDLARAFSWEDAPMGPRVAVVSNAGGPAVLCADAIALSGLELAPIDESTNKQLAQILPPSANIADPVDVLGDALPDRYQAAMDCLLATDKVDAVVAILTPQLTTQVEKTAEAIASLSEKYQKPIVCSFIGGGAVASGEAVLNKNFIPSFSYPERAIKALGAMWRWRKFQSSQEKKLSTPLPAFQFNLEKIREILAPAAKTSSGTLDSFSANEVILAAGILAPPTRLVDDTTQASNFVMECGWPVVAKLSSPTLLHKADIGGVITKISDPTQMGIVWEKLQEKMAQLTPEDRSNTKIQIQKEITDGLEIIVGVKRDKNFGLVMLFGAGGTLAEMIGDRNLQLFPIDTDNIQQLIRRSKVSLLLEGFRGQPALATEKLIDIMIRLGKLAESLPEIAEIEINPVMVTLNDAWAVDTKVIVGEGSATVAPSAPKFSLATTTSHKNLASKFHELTFQTPEPLKSVAGQYLSVKVAEQRINAYSIAYKTDVNNFGLLVDTSPGGPGSKFFEDLKVGDKMTFLGPFGTFTVKADDGAKRLILLATGSGIAPFRAMLEDLLIARHFSTPVTLYFGLRFKEDIFWDEYFTNLAKQFPNFTFKLVLSKPPDDWQGLKGHITDFLATDFPVMSDCAAYLCGNKPMIEEASTKLLNLGCPRQRIYSEMFA